MTVSGWTKEILGVNNAHQSQAHRYLRLTAISGYRYLRLPLSQATAIRGYRYQRLPAFRGYPHSEATRIQRHPAFRGYPHSEASRCKVQ